MKNETLIRRRIGEVTIRRTPIEINSEIQTFAPIGHFEMSSIEDIFGMQKRQTMQKVAHRSSGRWDAQGEGREDELNDTVFVEVQSLLSVEQVSADNILHPL